MYWWRLHDFEFDVAWIPSELNPADKWTRWSVEEFIDEDGQEAFVD